MIKFVFLKSLERPFSVFSGLLMMKCSFSVSDLYMILSEIPMMTEEDYKVFDDDNLGGKTVEVFFHLPKCVDGEISIERMRVEAMLTARRFFYHDSGKLFFCVRGVKINSPNYPNFKDLSIVHVRNDSVINEFERRSFESSNTTFGCLMRTRIHLYSLILKKEF